jgi:orotate phosphoribosyltransferase
MQQAVNVAKKDVVNYKTKLLECIKNNAVSRGTIKLSSGKISDLYIDAKMVTLDPEGAFLTAKVLLDILKDDDVDAVGGMTMGADPITGALAAISFEEGRPLKTFIVRKEPKKHGKQKWIEGPLSKDAKVVVIDDVTTTGKSILDSIQKIKESTDCKILKVISLVDRSEGARETLKNEGYDLVSIFDRKDLLGDQ